MTKTFRGTLFFMSNQDYISRAPTKKKNSPYKKKPVEASNKMSVKNKFIGLLVVCLVSAFSYGLWALKNNPITKEPLNEQIKKVDTKKANLPKPPAEKWSYVENLKTKEVEVGKYEVTQHGPYKMQCGSFKSQAQAERLKAKMAFVGIESSIQKAQGKHNVWYKVVLGPYAKKRAAEKDKHKLKNNKVNGCQIWLWK
ncbi:MAG: SPOR domain-containing protein [Colwellia sp.]